MAQITINIPDEHLARIQNAGINKAWVLARIKDAVKAYEAEQVRETERAKVEQAQTDMQTAIETAVATADAEITLS